MCRCVYVCMCAGKRLRTFVQGLCLMLELVCKRASNFCGERVFFAAVSGIVYK